MVEKVDLIDGVSAVDEKEEKDFYVLLCNFFL